MNLLQGRISNRAYWDVRPRAGEFFSLDKLGGYYFDTRAKFPYPGPLQDGIPVVQYGEGRPYPNPVIVAQCGLGALDTLQAIQDESARTAACVYADWFIQSQTPDGAWIFHHDVRGYGLYGSWPSCLGQGQGISFLVRMYALSGKEAYLAASLRAAAVMKRSVTAGGVRLTLNDGSEWLEEYPSPKPSLVLNGHIYALLAFYDLWLATADSAWLREYELLTSSTAAQLRWYDDAGWSLYDRAGRALANVASSVYHSRHIVQLEVLQQISPKPDFQRYIERWRNASRVRSAQALAQKILYRAIYGW